MDEFIFAGLTPYDRLVFAKAIQVGLESFGSDKCWDAGEYANSIFQGFNTSKKTHLIYKNFDARPLILAISGRERPDQEAVVVRKSICNSPYCLNPCHYYWGGRQDVAFENAQRKKKLNIDVIKRLRAGYESGLSCTRISKIYKLPYQTVRRICSGETYESINKFSSTINEKEVLHQSSLVCRKVIMSNPEEAKKLQLKYHEMNTMECPWHMKGDKKHKGNFGLMGECLDCMEQIKDGYCSVDVRNFDLRWYWQVKRFWEQVDVKDADSCWPWKGAVKEKKNESVACFPSPCHSAKTQSAHRVAFWLSRGYTGKYRVFIGKNCTPHCCNPAHLTIRELPEDAKNPTLKEVKLHHDDIFKHFKDRKA